MKCAHPEPRLLPFTILSIGLLHLLDYYSSLHPLEMHILFAENDMKKSIQIEKADTRMNDVFINV